MFDKRCHILTKDTLEIAVLPYSLGTLELLLPCDLADRYVDGKMAVQLEVEMCLW